MAHISNQGHLHFPAFIWFHLCGIFFCSFDVLYVFSILFGCRPISKFVYLAVLYGQQEGREASGSKLLWKAILKFSAFYSKEFSLSSLGTSLGTTPFEDEFIINQEPTNPYLLFVCSDLTILVILPDLCNCTFSAYFPQNESLPTNHLVWLRHDKQKILCSYTRSPHHHQ